MKHHNIKMNDRVFNFFSPAKCTIKCHPGPGTPRTLGPLLVQRITEYVIFPPDTICSRYHKKELSSEYPNLSEKRLPVFSIFPRHSLIMLYYLNILFSKFRLYIYIYIGIIVRVFANGRGDRDSIPGRIIPNHIQDSKNGTRCLLA